ncbi:hypothetical protein B0H11DRAFT_2186458 [Mycena galericulata]|nr:hypothetical protein B0H11DRAFT_2186458 [Mycena galericulata]
MQNDETVKSLNFLTLQEVSEPFFTEYATHYGIDLVDPLDRPKERSEIAMEVLFASRSRENPPTVPLLGSHSANYIDGVLHFRRCTTADYADPKKYGVFPVERLPGPEDDYSDDERAPPPVRQPPRPVMMDFVFPPQGRRMCEPTKEALEAERAGMLVPMREPLPEEYLGAMFEDLERESKHALEEHMQAEKTLMKAVYEHEFLRAEIEEERAAWRALWTYLEGVSGKEVVENCVTRVAQRMRGEIPEDELEEAVAQGHLIDPENNENGWKALVATSNAVPVASPRALVPAPAPAPAPRPVPAFTLPSLPSFRATFGGDETFFQQGPFLKRRRDSDVASDSDVDSDDSDAGPPLRASSSSHKRSRNAREIPVRSEIAAIAAPRGPVFLRPAIFLQNQDQSQKGPRSGRGSSRRRASPRTPHSQRALSSMGKGTHSLDRRPLSSPTSSKRAFLAAASS